MANDFALLRVGVDWSNKGVVCMGAKTTDPHNLISGGIYYQSHPTYAENGTLTKTYYGPNAYPTAGAIRWTWNVAQNGIMWMFRDSGTTRSLTVSPSTAYTMYVGYRPEPATFWDGTIQAMGWNGATWDVLETADCNGTDHDVIRYGDTSSVQYRQVQLTFTTASNHTRVAVKFTSAAWGAGNKNLEINGYMLVAGTYETEANGGVQLWWNCYADDSTCLHDDVTDFLMSAEYSLGKTEWDQALPQEGTATVVLRNDSKKFSPERTEFIGGYIVNRRVIIERAVDIKVSGINPLFQLQWSGWVKSLEPKTNIYGERTATLEALQGWYNIEKVPVTPVILNNVTTGQAMFQALRNGYELPTNSAFAKVGYGLVNNTWLVDPAVLIPNYASGITLDFVGMYWEDDANAQEILEELIDFENNWTWMNKYGAIHFIPAATITAASSATDLASSDIQDLEYQYGDEVWTSMKYTPLFQTLTPAVPENRFPLSDVVEVDIPALSSVNLATPHTYNNDYSPNDRSYGTHGDQIATAVRLDDLSTSVTIGGAGNSVILGFIGTTYDSRSPVTYGYQTVYWLNNTNAFPVKVTIQTLGYGWKLLYFDTPTEARNETLSNRFGYLARQLQNQYMQSETLTGNYVSRKILRYSNSYGWFPVTKIIPSDGTISTHANNLSVGRVWAITSEPQTIGSTKTMVVIGENTIWKPQILEKTIYSSPKF